MSVADRFLGKSRFWCVSVVVLSWALGGCNGHKPPPGPAVELSTPALLARINKNNGLIDNLWSRLDIKVESPDEKHSVGGHLILRKRQDGRPAKDLLLRGRDSLGQAEFQLGSNDQGYWYMLRAPGTDDVYSFVEYGDPDAPVGQAGQALDLLSVLGVYELPDELDQPPWPVCRGYDEPAYYVISFVERTAEGSLRVRKDVWWNRRSQQVDLIELFDEQGQRYLSAALDDYKKIGAAELATRIEIVWFEEKLTLQLKLKDVQINSTRVRDASFRTPDWAQ